MADSSHRSWYFVNKHGLVLGPFDEVKLTDKLSQKELTADSLVWNGTTASKWTRLSNVPGLLPRLRRKSRGFSQLEKTLKRISERASRARPFGEYLVPHPTPNSSASYSSSGECSHLSLTDMADDEEEKRPVLSPRPLLDPLHSERMSIDSERSRSSSVCDLPALVSSPSAGVSGRSRKSDYATFRAALMDRFSEEPLCLDDVIPDPFHRVNPGHTYGNVDVLASNPTPDSKSKGLFLDPRSLCTQIYGISKFGLDSLQSGEFVTLSDSHSSASLEFSIDDGRKKEDSMDDDDDMDAPDIGDFSPIPRTFRIDAYIE